VDRLAYIFPLMLMISRSVTRCALLAAAPVALLAAPLAVVAQPAPPTPTLAELAARRDSLAARVDSGVVVAFGARRPVHDFGQFFQLPTFRYLTNSDDADAAFVMVVRRGKGESTMFLTPQEVRRALYDGVRTDSSTSRARLGMRGRDFDELRGVLDSLARTGLPFYHVPDVETADFARMDSLTRGQEAIKSLIRSHPQLAVKNAMPLVMRLRARKSATELALIRHAAAISSEGHRAAMLTANPQHEYELRAALEFEFTRRGAARPAYGSIVGAGINGTQLHYMRASDPVGPNDLVVMDAAAEFQGYAADVTRTIPVSGRYSAEQKAIYQLVRDSQDAAERNSKPGMKIRAATDSSVVVRAKGLAALGLIESADASFDPPWKVDCAAQPAACRQSMLWMVHGISHGIGLEVHDPLQGSGPDGVFAVGDAFTIEPGIYISTRTLNVLPDTPKNRAFKAAVQAKVRQYENTGVRIEDDYVVTEKGLEWISKVPREIPEIEALMRQRPRVTP
jgi:Xaa-Pro aminopeptidase